jgi:hypothetical protein
MIQIPLRPELHPLFEALGYLIGFAAYKRARQMSGDVVNEHQRWRVIAAATLGALLEVVCWVSWSNRLVCLSCFPNF